MFALVVLLVGCIVRMVVVMVVVSVMVVSEIVMTKMRAGLLLHHGQGDVNFSQSREFSLQRLINNVLTCKKSCIASVLRVATLVCYRFLQRACFYRNTSTIRLGP